jgi:hypothetical protein
MNLYAIVAERPQPDKTLVKEMQYVVADSLCAALAWAVTTGTPIEEIQGITCACPVTAVVRGDLSTALPCCKACPVETTKPPE